MRLNELSTVGWSPIQLERWLRGLAVALGVLLCLLLIEASPAARAVVAEPEVPGGGVLRWIGGLGDEGAAKPPVQLTTHLELSIRGPLALATLTQRFRNDSADWREADYLLPLPPDAAVRRMDLQIGDRRIEGRIREREEARRGFEEARRAGEQAALLEQQRAHLFTTRLTNIPPGALIEVEVSLVLPVDYRDGLFSLRFPTTVTPPYVPGDPLAPPAQRPEARKALSELSLDGSGWAVATDQVSDAPLVTARQYAQVRSDSAPHNPMTLGVDLDPGFAIAEIEALYHDLAVAREGDRYRLTFATSVVEMDRDLVLRWRPRRGAAPQAALFTETLDGEQYALLMVLPPATEASTARIARELVMVIDVSGSMQGAPIRQARDSARRALDSLVAGDRLNILAFSDRLFPLFETPVPITDAVLRQAREFIDDLDADGGTEMLPALEQAMATRRKSHPPVAAEAQALRQILFITDGAVANEEALLDLVARHIADSRLFMVGIGSAPNSYLLREAAELGRGDAVFIADPDEVAPVLDGLFERLSRPMARSLRVDWPGVAEAYPARLPDLYAGQPLLQVARLDVPLAGNSIQVSGDIAGRQWSQTIHTGRVETGEGVGYHWAREKLAALLALGRRGVRRETLRDQVLPLALQFSLASPFTSFLAREVVQLRPDGAPLAPGQVPNARPLGQAPQPFAYAQTATSGPVKLYLGLLFLFTGVLGWVMSRPEPS